MRRSLLLLTAVVLAGAGVFTAGHRAVEWLCTRQPVRPGDDLDWLRIEFRLSDGDLARVRQLHEGYVPVCRQWCERIDARKQELQMALTSSTNAAPLVEQKLLEIGALRARCQAAMLRHFREVSDVMPPEQGRRYLAEMQRLTLGFHDQMEHSMSIRPPAAHGHN
jgi:hypothetical protein